MPLRRDHRHIAQYGGHSGGGAARWNPSVFSGLVAWYYADTIVGADASAVSQWNDSSGNGYHLTQGTGAAQPTLQTAEINGHSTVQFDGTDDCLTKTSFADIGDTYTCFQVIKFTVGGDADQGLYEVSNNGTLDSGWIVFATGTAMSFRALDSVNSKTLTNNVDDRDGTPRVFVNQNSGTSMTGFRDGTAWSGVATGYTAPNPNVTNQLDIGKVNAAGFFLRGHIAEFILYNTSLSAGNRDTVESELGLIYGITVA